jgi:hypothetical protein
MLDEESIVYGLFEVTAIYFNTFESVYLGVHEGYIDEIALSLNSEDYDRLIFKKFITPKLNERVSDTVNIVLDDDIYFNEIKDYRGRLSKLEEVFKDRNVEVTEYVNLDGTISYKLTKFDTDEEKIKKALNKLTDEEKLLLGLN